MPSRSLFVLLTCLPAVAPSVAHADTFGSGENVFTIPFVAVGDAGNAADTTGAPNPAGRVDYWYRIGKYEIPEEAIRKANSASEAAGDPLGITIDERGPQKPATRVSWFEAARFVNWLNEDQGGPAAYKFNAADEFELWQPGDAGYNPANPFRNTAARYFLPSIDEWYKAAFYDPTTGGYFDYPTGSDDPPIPVASGTDPGTAVWNVDTGPADVQFAGGPSGLGTVGQGGNVFEWQETQRSQSYNLTNLRALRGSDWTLTAVGPVSLASDSTLSDRLADRGAGSLGLRIVSIPEPGGFLAAVAAMVGAATGSRRLRRRRSIGTTRPVSGCESLEQRRMLATLTVNSLADAASPVDGQGLTLREAIVYVNGDVIPDETEKVQNGVVLIDETVDPLGQNDRIVFADGVFNGTDEALIELMHTYQGGVGPSNSALIINAPVEIEAPVGKRVVLSASNVANNRVLAIAETTDEPVIDVAITRLSFTGGRATGGAGVQPHLPRSS